MALVLALTVIALFVALAAAIGTDSRDGDDWIIHRSV
jgi:hypothetical protein